MQTFCYFGVQSSSSCNSLHVRVHIYIYVITELATIHNAYDDTGGGRCGGGVSGSLLCISFCPTGPMIRKGTGGRWGGFGRSWCMGSGPPGDSLSTGKTRGPPDKFRADMAEESINDRRRRRSAATPTFLCATMAVFLEAAGVL